MRELAKKGDAGFAQMNTLMGDAFDETLNFLKPTYSVGGQAFLSGEEFQRFLSAGHDPAGVAGWMPLGLETICTDDYGH